MQLGKMGKAKSGGIPVGGTPYGYTKDKSGRPVVFEVQASVVRKIYILYTQERLTTTGIARQLDYEGIPTAKGGKRPLEPNSSRSHLEEQRFTRVNGGTVRPDTRRTDTGVPRHGKNLKMLGSGFRFQP